MAILKHIASKNANYAEIQRYLMFEHDEDTNKPILDENDELILRKEYIMDGINCDPFTFDMECRELNTLHHKSASIWLLLRVATTDLSNRSIMLQFYRFLPSSIKI